MTRARVMAVVAAGRRIADPQDPLGAEARQRLPLASGLSVAGVELALSHHLETDPSDDDIDALLASAEPSPRCHVVLASNVCIAPLRALACAVASSASVRLKPSRRDPVVAELLVRALSEPDILVTETIGARSGEALHLYGSDEAIAEVTASVDPEVRVTSHGHGIGVAVVDWPDRRAAEAIAEDLVAFDGRGCLSPRVVIASGDPERFGELLHQALGHHPIARGRCDHHDRAALQRYGRTMEAVGRWLQGPHHGVACDPDPEAIALPPPLRSTIVVPANGIAHLDPTLVTTIGHDGGGELFQQLAERCPRARRAALGDMQRPPLDGPVDRR